MMKFVFKYLYIDLAIFSPTQNLYTIGPPFIKNVTTKLALQQLIYFSIH